MNVTCPQCRSVFRLDPAKITSVSLRARCSVCGGIIPVGASVRWSDDLTAPRPTPSGATSAHPQASAPRETPGSVKGRTRTPPFASRVSTPTPASGATPPAAPRAPSSPMPAAPPRAPVSPTPASAAPATPSFGAPLRPPPRTTIPEPPRQPEQPVVGKPTPSPFRAKGDSAAAFSTPSTPTPQAVPTGKRPINPFLANDPNHKARRLARALVSDMVAYHPTKREEGLKSGTLKQVFREEIKKSYEEYVEQVGREFAQSTSHFQDALNDVLAGGRKIF
jgi:predicted Zn finger-like uncharacterized protein